MVGPCNYKFAAELTELNIASIISPEPEEMGIPELLLEELARSIAEVGLINPIVVGSAGENRFEVLSGFKRFFAFRRGNAQRIPAYVERTPEKKFGALSRGILENRGFRKLNMFEIASHLAYSADKLAMGNEKLLGVASGLFGIDKSLKVLNIYLLINRLPRNIKRYLVRVSSDLRTAHSLCSLNENDAASIEWLIDKVSLTFSEFKGALELLRDIASRDKMSYGAILEKICLSEICAGNGKDRSRGGEKLIGRLTRLRNPILTARGEKFTEHVKSMGLPGDVRISAPEKFDDGPYRIEIDFGSIESFRERLNLLTSLETNETFRSLMRSEG